MSEDRLRSSHDVDQMWRTVPLGEVAVIERRAIQPEGIKSGTPYVGLENIVRGGDFLNVKPIEAGVLASSKFQFNERHILFGKLRPNLGKIATPDFAGICSTDILPILPGPELDRGYLAHYLRQPTVVDLAASRASGANLPRLSPTVLQSFPVPLPPLAEQRRIAAILDHADALRAKRRQTLDLLDTLTQSIFTEMFGTPDQVLSQWPTDALGSRLDFLSSGSRGWAKYYADRGGLFIRIQNVRAGRIRLEDMAFVRPPDTAETRRTSVRAGDVLLSITADLGRAAVVPEGLGQAYINQHLALMRPQGMESVFLAHYLESPAGGRYFRSRNRNGVKAGLNFDDIRSMPVPLPPSAMQRDFADRLDQLHSDQSLAHQALSALRAFVDSLQHRAFRGDL